MSRSAHSSKKMRNALINKLKRDPEIKFEEFELQNLARKYDELCGDKPYLERFPFRDFLFQAFDYTDPVMLDRVFQAFDTDRDGKISLEEWFRGLFVILRGDPLSQARFCFSVYDVKSLGYIGRDEMFPMLKKTLHVKISDDDADEGPKDLIDMVFKLVKPSEGTQPYIYQEEYEQTVVKNTLMMECFGPCLPSSRRKEEFEDLVCHAGHPEYMRSSSRHQYKR